MKSLITLIFWRDVLIRWCTLLTLIFYSTTWILFVIKILPLAREMEFLSLHYNIYFGIDLIGQWYKALIIPGVGLIFFTVNTTLVFFFYKRDKFLSRLLAMCNALVGLGLLASVVLIILLNI
jgi:hypothetical protein